MFCVKLRLSDVPAAPLELTETRVVFAPAVAAAATSLNVRAKGAPISRAMRNGTFPAMSATTKAAVTLLVTVRRVDAEAKGRNKRIAFPPRSRERPADEGATLRPAD